jgi:hypothetical protein
VTVTSSLFRKRCAFPEQLHRLALPQSTLNYFKDKVYRKAYCMVTLWFEWKGVVMTGEEEGEKAVTQFCSPVDARARIAGSPREDQARAPLAVQSGTERSPPPQIQVLRLWSNGSASHWVSVAWSVGLGGSA